MGFVHSRSQKVRLSGDPYIDGLLRQLKWRNDEIFYSDPDEISDYGDFYWSDGDGDAISAQFELDDLQITGSQLAAVHRALNASYLKNGAAKLAFSVSGFTELDLTHAGSGSRRAEIRVANTSEGDLGYGYYPDSADVGGDAWIHHRFDRPAPGNLDNFLILHELGHALGLKHGHPEDGYKHWLPADVDGNEFSVMTYRPYPGAEFGETGEFGEWSAPQSFMMGDIAALQYMYGAHFTINAGDTVYSWSPEDGRSWVDGKVGINPGGLVIFATIWDGGGTDTYDLSAYDEDLRLDLRPGMASTFSRDQLADLRQGPKDVWASGSIYNALQFEDDPRSLIENAIGGSGADWIRGNDADNLLRGRAGDDTLRGGSGADLLCGGTGDDIFRFGRKSDSGRKAADTLIAGNGGAAFDTPGWRTGDLINLRPIDANSLKYGDQSFRFGEKQGTGRLWAEDRNGDTVVLGNTDRDKRPEFKLVIADGAARAEDYSGADFLL